MSRWSRRAAFVNRTKIKCPNWPLDFQASFICLQGGTWWTTHLFSSPFPNPTRRPASARPSTRPPTLSESISARRRKKPCRTKFCVCSARRCAKCNFFLNLIKKSLTIRLRRCSKTERVSLIGRTFLWAYHIPSVLHILFLCPEVKQDCWFLQVRSLNAWDKA